jgi:dephospho-CoA kinase
MLKIGITGGIGSGKTTVCKILEVLKVPIYNSDQRAKEIMVSNSKLKDDLRHLFGNSIFNSDGDLNTVVLASIVFKNIEKLKELNGIVHPIVLEDFSKWCENNTEAKYTVLESAIIFESGIEQMLDYVIIVDAPIDIRIQRIMSRENISREKVLQRMNNQILSEEKNKLSNFIIFNDGKKSLTDQVLTYHKQFSGE